MGTALVYPHSRCVWSKVTNRSTSTDEQHNPKFSLGHNFPSRDCVDTPWIKAISLGWACVRRLPSVSWLPWVITGCTSRQSKCKRSQAWILKGVIAPCQKNPSANSLTSMFLLNEVHKVSKMLTQGEAGISSGTESRGYIVNWNVSGF